MFGSQGQGDATGDDARIERSQTSNFCSCKSKDCKSGVKEDFQVRSPFSSWDFHYQLYKTPGVDPYCPRKTTPFDITQIRKRRSGNWNNS